MSTRYYSRTYHVTKTRKFCCKAGHRGCPSCTTIFKPDLFELVIDNNHEELKEALEKHKYNLEERDSYGATALIKAGEKGTSECIKILLDHGADIEAGDNCDYTALKRAVERRQIDPTINPDSIKILLEHGAIAIPDIRKRYPQYADLWPKEKPSPTDLLAAVENIRKQMDSFEEPNLTALFQALTSAKKQLDSLKSIHHRLTLLEDQIKLMQ